MKTALAFVAMLLALALPASAQFIGYTLPQTVNAQVMNAVTTATVTPNTGACPPASGAACAVPQLGQSVHAITYTFGGTVTTADLRLEGSYTGLAGSFFPISDEATQANSIAGTQATLVAFGYYPFIRVNLVTLAGTNPTITVNYSGTVSPTVPYGNQQAALTWKTLGASLDATVPQTPNINVYGLAGGFLLVKYFTATCTTSTIAVTYSTPNSNLLNIAVLPATALAANTNLQWFFLPTYPAMTVNVTYTPVGCAAGALVNISYGSYNSIQMIGGSNYAANNLQVPQVVKVDSSGSLYTSIVPPAAGVDVNLKDVGGNATVTAGVNGLLAVGGAGASGAAVSGNPVLVAGSDGTNARTVSTTTTGRVLVSNAYTPADGTSNTNVAGSPDAVTAGLGAIPYVFNGTTWDRWRSASLANFPTAQTLTARNSIGAALAEKGSRWSVFSNPAANNQATASIALETNVRHVADCVSFSAAATAAPAATALTINLRDGATGAGTVIWTWQVVVTASTGQLVAPHSVCGLNLVGTTGTAMTLEFSAGLTNLIQSVSLSGYNVN